MQNVGRDDFAIVDSGYVVREFRSLTPSDKTPLDVVVLVDASESAEQRFQETLGGVGNLMAETNGLSRDQFSVVTFAGLQSHVLCTADCGNISADQRLRLVKAEGATPLFDALVDVGKTLSEPIILM